MKVRITKSHKSFCGNIHFLKDEIYDVQDYDCDHYITISNKKILRKVIRKDKCEIVEVKSCKNCHYYPRDYCTDGCFPECWTEKPEEDFHQRINDIIGSVKKLNECREKKEHWRVVRENYIKRLEKIAGVEKKGNKIYISSNPESKESWLYERFIKIDSLADIAEKYGKKDMVRKVMADLHKKCVWYQDELPKPFCSCGYIQSLSCVDGKESCKYFKMKDVVFPSGGTVFKADHIADAQAYWGFESIINKRINEGLFGVNEPCESASGKWIDVEAVNKRMLEILNGLGFDYKKCKHYAPYALEVKHICRNSSRSDIECTKDAIKCREFVENNLKNKNMKHLKKVVKESPKNCVNLCEVDRNKLYGFVCDGRIHIITGTDCNSFGGICISDTEMTWSRDRFETLKEVIVDVLKFKDVYQAENIFDLIEGLKNLK